MKHRGEIVHGIQKQAFHRNPLTQIPPQLCATMHRAARSLPAYHRRLNLLNAAGCRAPPPSSPGSIRRNRRPQAKPAQAACAAAGAVGKRRILFWLLRWGFIASVWLTLAAIVVVLWFARDLPRPESALDAARRPSLTLEDRSGHVIATFGDLVGEPLRLKDFPPALPAAVVAVEDRRFWHHSGIDPIGLLRAAWVNSAPAASCRAAPP